MTEVRLDPASTEIFFNKLDQSLNESQQVVRYLSASPIVREAGEALEALYLPDGEAVNIACGILMHFINVTRGIRYMNKNNYSADDIGIYEGDQFVNNDAYVGGMHCPDTCLIQPFFYKGEQLGWVAAITHTSETGGIEPMGMCPSAKEAWHDGLIMPLVKLVEKGKIRRDVMNMFLRGTRDPDTFELDMRARMAGNERAIRKLTELVDEFGAEFFKKACNKLVDEGEDLFRAKLKEFRPGIYTSRVYADTLGANEEKLAVIQTDLEITEEGEMIVHIPVISPQQPCFNNAFLPAVEATVMYCLLTTFLWDARWNSGPEHLIELDVPKASRLNADPSQSVGYATVGIALTFSHSFTGALGRAYYGAGKLEESQAGGPGSWNDMLMGGVDDDGRACGGLFLTVGHSFGSGGRYLGDGFPNYALYNPWNQIPDVEGEEAKLPGVHLALGLVPGSAGPGKHRSSNIAHGITAVHRSPLSVITHNGMGGRLANGQGIFGGYPGPKTRVRVVTNTDLYEKIKNDDPIPQDPTDLDAVELINGDHVEYGASVGKVNAKSGDISDRFSCGSSGGFGDPLDRDPMLVLKDFKEKLIGSYDARRQYCVEIDEEKQEVNLEATEKLRKEKIQERLKKGIPGDKFLKNLVEKRKKRDFTDVVLEFYDELMNFSDKFKLQVEGEEKLANRTLAPLGKVVVGKELFDLSPYIFVGESKQGKKIIFCKNCGFGFCDAKENYKLHGLIYERDPEDIYQKRLAPDKEWGLYREFYCPECGVQYEVEQCPPCMTVIPDVILKGIN